MPTTFLLSVGIFAFAGVVSGLSGAASPCGSISFAKAISSPPPVQLRVQPVEKLRDRKGAFQAWPAACTATTGADFAAGIRRVYAKSGEGGRGGETCFPVRQLVKKSFG